jgi:hypothetical protein
MNVMDVLVCVKLASDDSGGSMVENLSLLREGKPG